MFMLVSVYEREICEMFFKTEKEAFDTMVKDLKEIVDEYSDTEFEEQEERDDEWDYDERRAWCNYKYNMDWKIVKIELDI